MKKLTLTLLLLVATGAANASGLSIDNVASAMNADRWTTASAVDVDTQSLSHAASGYSSYQANNPVVVDTAQLQQSYDGQS